VPELPEVETTRRHLAEHLPGARIAGVDLPDPRALQRPDPATFAARVTGAVIAGVQRRGKYLLVPLMPPERRRVSARQKRNAGRPTDGAEAAAGEYLIIHRRMTGNLFLRDADAPPDPYTVAVLYLEDEHALRFCDKRRFARLWLARPAEVAELEHTLGPEPLSPEFTAERLTAILANRRGQLKPLLLNQSLIAGLGNIYVDEALFVAGLHPTRTAESLTADDLNRLHAAIRAVLEQGIRNEGTSFRDYLGAVGLPGRNQLMVEVFRRQGQPCPRCGATIAKTRVGGRGTHFCAQCQPVG
jgi:formamidopyrimidine-DNA glycosylase